MTRQEFKPKSFQEQEKVLLETLDQAVTELDRFKVFTSDFSGRIPDEAQKAAFTFAAAYGHALHAGVNLEREPYFPAEVQANVALGAAKWFEVEVKLLRHEFSTTKELWRKNSDKKEELSQKVHELFRHYLEIAAAFTTIWEVYYRYHRWIEEMARREDRSSLGFEHPVLKEIRGAQLTYEQAREMLYWLGWQLKQYIEPDRIAWQDSVEQRYWDVIKPLL